MAGAQLMLAEALHNFHFLRPAWLLALPLLWALAWFLARRAAASGVWSQLIDAELLPALRLTTAGGGRRWRLWLALAWSLAVIALAGPSWRLAPAAAWRAPAAWLLLLDLSPSMNAADLKPNRVSRARFAIDDLLGAARDARVGLVVFAAEAHAAAPLTADIATIRTLTSPLRPQIMPLPGDNLAPALKLSAALLQQATGRQRQLFILSDGVADAAAALNAAADLRRAGVVVNVIGVGSRDGAPTPDADGRFSVDAQGDTLISRLDADQLRQLAQAGGGRYVDIAALPALIADLQAQRTLTSAATAAQGEQVQQWRDEGYWLLPALLLLTALLLRRSGA